MIKKISALFLALVLCFSVVVLPVSASGFSSDYELASGKNFGYKLEFDKANYNPGDTVTVNVYLKVSESETIEVDTIHTTFAIDSKVFDITKENTSEAVKQSSTANDVYKSFNAEPSLTTWGYQAATIKGRIEAASTEDEKATYNEYLKVSSKRNKNGTHANAGKTTQGLPAADINGDPAPFFSFKLKLRDDIAVGTNISVAITSGILNAKPSQLSVNYFNNTVSTKKLPSTPAMFDISQAVATATVGAPAPAGPVVAKAKSQVKMTVIGENTVDDDFSFRVISKISDSDWDTYFKNTGVKDAKNSYITAVGMVAYKGAAAFDAETAKKVVAGTSAENYTAATTNYISKVSDTADAEFGAIIKVKHSTLKNDVTYMGFVQYVDASGNPQTIFYETAGTAALSTNYDNIVSAYLARYSFAA